MVYKWRPDQPFIATGDFLGDVTHELDGDGITEFVSGGARIMGTRPVEVKSFARYGLSP